MYPILKMMMKMFQLKIYSLSSITDKFDYLQILGLKNVSRNQNK